MKTATWLYRALLHLYPARFRREYGPLMVTTFEDMSAQASADGRTRALLQLWWRVGWDLISSAVAEHLDEKGRWMTARNMWLLWILASIGGWLAAAWVLLPVIPPLTIPIGGALVSALHVMLLQRFLAAPGWWWRTLPLKAGSWLLPLPLFAVVPWERLSGLPFVAVYLALLLVSAALVGWVQTLALRPLLHVAWRWALAPVSGLLAAAAVGATLVTTLLPLAANLIARGTLSVALPAGIISPATANEMGLLLPLLNLLIAMLAAAAYGVVTGAFFLSAVDGDAEQGTVALI